MTRKPKWIKAVARRWYALGYSALAHAHKEGLKFSQFYWTSRAFTSVRYGGPYIIEFEYNGSFQDTNFTELIHSEDPSLEKDFDAMEAILLAALSARPAADRQSALAIYSTYKKTLGIMIMAYWVGRTCQELLRKKLEGDFEKHQLTFAMPYKPTTWVRERKAVQGGLSLDVLVSDFGFLHADGRATAWTANDYREDKEQSSDESISTPTTVVFSDPHIQWLARIAQRLAFLFDEGKCACLRANWALRQTINNSGYRESEVMGCSEAEFIEWAKTGRFPSGNISERERFHATYWFENTYEEYFGQGAVDAFLAREHITEFAEKVPETTDLRGQGVYPGVVRGKVRNTITEDDARKLVKGEILVSAMTQPELLHGMRKAAAFVTDEGGLLCHAAIIAREMKKPCIIGTRVATEILKDGDLVEVDAEKGVVRILEKA